MGWGRRRRPVWEVLAGRMGQLCRSHVRGEGACSPVGTRGDGICFHESLSHPLSRKTNPWGRGREEVQRGCKATPWPPSSLGGRCLGGAEPSAFHEGTIC